MLFEKLVISIRMMSERVAHQSLYDINILVTEEGVMSVCVCSELTQSGKEKFSQQQLTVKWETEEKGMVNTEQLVIWRYGTKRQVKATMCGIL